MTQPPPEPWQWDEAEWRRRVGQVRAGRSLKPATWPGGARCAVALSFDSDHETNELRDGGNSIGRMSWGQYGNRVGVPRVARLLDRFGVRASFYVPAVVALTYPEEQRALVAAGVVMSLRAGIDLTGPDGRASTAAIAPVAGRGPSALGPVTSGFVAMKRAPPSMSRMARVIAVNE